MFIVHVIIKVKPEMIDEFVKATVENAKNSIREPGITRFDFIQQSDNPSNFVLVEVYKTQNDSAAHKETAHYTKWRDTVADMMAEPRQGIKYTNLFPPDYMWSK